MARDYSPVQNTCPKIDEVIAFLETIDSEDVSRTSIKDVVNVMEEIRSMNAELREWGNDEYRRAESLDDDLRRMESEKDDVEREVSRLEKEVDELTSELNNIN
jgi:chromosome segregation ATPase